MELSIVEFFQSFRSDFFDFFFQIFNEFGDELVFLIVASLLWWVVNKHFAYRFMMIFLTSVAVNDIFKNLVKRPRPYTNTSVVSITEPTYGYSFPSGHAQNAGTMALVLNERYGKVAKWVQPVLIAIVVLVMLARIYLGQHYLSDVIVGLAMSIVVYAAFIYFAPKIKISPIKLVYYAIPIMVLIGFFIVDKNYYVAVGSMIGLTLGYDLELRYVKYEVKAKATIQIAKYAIGIIVALLLKEGLKLVFPYSGNDDLNLTQLDLILDGFRYFILTVWLSLGSMWVFKKLFGKFQL
ncbi:phosphatase PAP2 family protein [Acholeplasma vituli]|uniref:Phosphatase PAP2 family protein n=1 Tax=Paracholeplasma vituli TaxID=69473 RepID=A0ABT2PXP6_9MOLU|nr:phosphatase PAP2 family protein [Paracholeplasma vituli]MCU0105498.1 phosphatase PAP2 family protein [Paracholeplasma vituli]